MGDEVYPYPVIMQAHTLANALKAGLLCCGKDDMLPTLTCLHVTYSDDRMVVESTNRFHAVRVEMRIPRGENETKPDPFDIMLDRQSVSIVLALMGKGLRATEYRPIEVSVFPAISTTRESYGGTDTLEHVYIQFEKKSLKQPLYQAGKYPKVDHLFAEEKAEVGAIKLDPRYLAKLGQMPGRYSGQGIDITFQGTPKKVVSRWGDGNVQYAYLLMPMRPAS